MSTWCQTEDMKINITFESFKVKGNSLQILHYIFILSLEKYLNNELEVGNVLLYI